MKNDIFLHEERCEKYVGKGVPTKYFVYVRSRKV